MVQQKCVTTNSGSCHRNPFPCDLRPVSSVVMPLPFWHEEQISLDTGLMR